MTKHNRYMLIALFSMALSILGLSADTGYCGFDSHACCNTVCYNAAALQPYISANNIVNAEIFNICCMCVIIGNYNADPVQRLWFVNQCGSLQQLAAADPSAISGSITVSGIKVCGACFLKATVTNVYPTTTTINTSVWQVNPTGVLTQLTWDNAIPAGQSVTDVAFTAVKQCGMCLVKATLTVTCPLDSEVCPSGFRKLAVLWFVDTDGSLIELIGPDAFAASINVVGVRVCGICFLQATLQGAGSSVILWRVENDGSLTQLVGPDTNLSATSLSVIGVQNGTTCDIQARLGSCIHVWRVESDGSLSTVPTSDCTPLD